MPGAAGAGRKRWEVRAAGGPGAVEGTRLVELLRVALVVLAVAAAAAPGATAWVTNDNGDKIVFHGDVQVGPSGAVSKYNMQVLGDMSVGVDESRKLDQFAADDNVDVDGVVAANAFAFRYADSNLRFVEGDRPEAPDELHDFSKEMRDVVSLGGTYTYAGDVGVHTIALTRQTARLSSNGGTEFSIRDTPFTISLDVDLRDIDDDKASTTPGCNPISKESNGPCEDDNVGTMSESGGGTRFCVVGRLWMGPGARASQTQARDPLPSPTHPPQTPRFGRTTSPTWSC